ncbi:putative quinol monooxygenase [Sphingomonas sp. NFR15]|uniref:putative quinol monooxygenase n=1 Tax=Sphingomonas sp. NFR15 TaxID=1566282 RepID=UPI0008907C7C|nr:putative quinol monooxygenase [Sphingomonas sp. NFR15]SDA31843.1 Quinol monooxygenase YgiN [Sphingomonas sp. NFR15]
MLLIAGTIRLPAENVAAARDAIAAVVTATRAEDGCLEYRFAEDVLDPGLIHITERWRDRAALDAHFGTPHIAAWRAAGTTLGIGGRALTLYDVGAGKAI